MAVPPTDQWQSIELHPWTLGVAFQWEQAMDLAEALPANQLGSCHTCGLAEEIYTETKPIEIIPIFKTLKQE